MRTAVAAADMPRKGYICGARAEGLQCWMRDGHDGQHMTVPPNLDRDVCTRPMIHRW